MPKPSSIRIAQILLYLKLLLTAFFMIRFIPIVILILVVLLIAANLYAIHKRKRLMSFILALLVLYFSSTDIINLVLSFAVIVLLFTRSSRMYFAGGAAASDPAPESGEAIDTEGYAVDEGNEAETEPGEPAAEDETSRPAEASAPPVSTEPSPAPAAIKREGKPSANPEVEIREAEAGDAEIVQRLMMEAFEEYRAAVPPSSALSETVESVREALETKSESAAILTEDGIPAAMVRYRLEDNAIYFFRLSVRPARRKRGYARRLIEWIETRGRSQGLEISRCKVRQSVSRNLVLYENMGYEVTNQELVVRPEGSVKTLTMEKRLINV